MRCVSCNLQCDGSACTGVGRPIARAAASAVRMDPSACMPAMLLPRCYCHGTHCKAPRPPGRPALPSCVVSAVCMLLRLPGLPHVRMCAGPALKRCGTNAWLAGWKKLHPRECNWSELHAPRAAWVREHAPCMPGVQHPRPCDVPGARRHAQQHTALSVGWPGLLLPPHACTET